MTDDSMLFIAQGRFEIWQKGNTYRIRGSFTWQIQTALANQKGEANRLDSSSRIEHFLKVEGREQIPFDYNKKIISSNEQVEIRILRSRISVGVDALTSYSVTKIFCGDVAVLGKCSTNDS